MNDTDGYQGWKNYPTWAVNLWLSNDEALYNEALDIARDVYRGQIESTGNADPNFGLGVLAQSYKDWVTNDLAPDLGATFAADLLGYALDEVDWYEIAKAWIEQVQEQVEA